MFGSDILEVAIGMVFLYLFMSMIASALREAFEALLQQRAVFLERGLVEMLRHWGPDKVQAFYDHPMISSLYKGDYANRLKPLVDIPWLWKVLSRIPLLPKLLALFPQRSLLPAYIPSESFSLAILDLIADTSAAGQVLSLGSLQQALTPANPQVKPNAVQRVVLMALATADNDMDAVRKNLENWYDSTMQRVTGWYARRSAVFLFALGLGAAVALNVDSITIAKSLTVDRSLRQAIVAQAEKYARNQSERTSPSGAEPSAVASAVVADTSPAGTPVEPSPPGEKKPEGGTSPAPAAGGGAPPKPDSGAQKGFDVLRTEFTEIGFPIGWTTGKDGWWYPAPQGCRVVADGDSQTKTECGQSGSYVGMWLLAIMGWLITAIAIMLGAPFWFDLLNKLISLRSALKPPTDNQGSKT